MDPFVIWEKIYKEGSCVIENPNGFDDLELLSDGLEFAIRWPEDVVCRMSTRYLKDIQLTDNLYGADFAVVSGRLKEHITVHAVGNRIEYLPVTILNHKGRVASKDYFILNPVGTIDCIDVQKSGVTWNKINPDAISRVKKLVLKKETIPEDVGVFRPAHLTHKILLRRTLAKQISADGFTGLAFQELATVGV